VPAEADVVAHIDTDAGDPVAAFHNALDWVE